MQMQFDRVGIIKGGKVTEFFTRAAIESIQIGQTGLYIGDSSYPVTRVGEVRRIFVGQRKGAAFRMVWVRGSHGAEISFIVTEGDQKYGQ